MIDLKNIDKFYHTHSGSVHALQNINIKIRAGESVAIVGQSGSGKSTLMNIIGLLDIPEKGEYFLNNRNINTLDADSRSYLRGNTLGFIFQGFNLMPRLSALENVELPLLYTRTPPKTRRELARAALDSVGLSHRLNHRPFEMSGGQQQRVAIARAIIRKPPILLADEPTGNLDRTSGADVLNLLSHLNKSGTTVVLITHDRSISRQMSRRIEISDGKIVHDSERI